MVNSCEGWQVMWSMVVRIGRSCGQWLYWLVGHVINRCESWQVMCKQL